MCELNVRTVREKLCQPNAYSLASLNLQVGILSGNPPARSARPSFILSRAAA